MISPNSKLVVLEDKIKIYNISQTNKEKSKIRLVHTNLIDQRKGIEGVAI